MIKNKNFVRKPIFFKQIFLKLQILFGNRFFFKQNFLKLQILFKNPNFVKTFCQKMEFFLIFFTGVRKTIFKLYLTNKTFVSSMRFVVTVG